MITAILVATYEQTAEGSDGRAIYQTKYRKCVKPFDLGWGESASHYRDMKTIFEFAGPDLPVNAPASVALQAATLAQHNGCDKIWVVHPGGRK